MKKLLEEQKKLKELEDYVFCIKYELDTLALSFRKSHLERWVLGFTDSALENEHKARYLWVSQFVDNKSVLDFSSGPGSGSYILADTGKAKSIEGCDIDPEAIKYASIHNNHPKIIYSIENGESYYSKKLFDVIVSFETIEHIINVKAYLLNMKNALKENGVFFVSTPIPPKYMLENPDNPFHIIEWRFSVFQDIVSEFFNVEEIYLQIIWKEENVFTKILKKLIAKFRVHHGKKMIEKDLTPVLWDLEKPSRKDLDSIIYGVQILKCIKK